MSLTKEAILAASKPKVVEVDVADWGGKVKLRELSIDEVAQFAGQNTADGGTSNRILAMSIVGDDGQPMFTPEEIGAMAAPRAIKELTAEISKLNGFTADDQATIAKNSETSPGASSSSA